jgi:hypothetical protein
MARLEYDFARREVAERYPGHGWALYSQGAKIVWCPLRQVLAWPEETLRKKGLSDRVELSSSHDPLPFSETLQKLAVSLRELHRLVRTACDRPCNLEPESLTADLEALEKIPLFIDLIFIYLRRIPDRLAVASLPLLFQHWQSAPREFKKWIDDIDKLEAYKPICNFAALREVIKDNSAWFESLRDTLASGKKGLRDALEHRGVRFLVGKRQIGDERPRFTVMVDSRASDVEVLRDILPQVPDSVEGLCRLMTGVHSAIGVGDTYRWGDFINLVGMDDDIAGYWPRIEALSCL